MAKFKQAIRIQVQKLKKELRILLDPFIGHGCTNPGCQIAQEATLCTVSPNIRGSSVQKLLNLLNTSGFFPYHQV